MWKYPYKTLPYEHQRNALKESAEKKNGHTLWKWVQVKQKLLLIILLILFLQRKNTFCLIIAPKSVYT